MDGAWQEAMVLCALRKGHAWRFVFIIENSPSSCCGMCINKITATKRHCDEAAYWMLYERVDLVDRIAFRLYVAVRTALDISVSSSVDANGTVLVAVLVH